MLLVEKYTKAEFVGLLEPTIGADAAESVWSLFRFREPINKPTITTKDGDTLDIWKAGVENTALLYGPRFLDYLRNETVVFDPMVTDYVERMIQNVKTGTATNSATNTESTSGEVTHGKTLTTATTDNTTDTYDSNDRLTRNTTDTNNSTNTTTNNLTETTNGTEQTEGENRTIAAGLPQSISYSGQSGIPSALDWSVASSQEESDNNQDTTRSNTTTNTGTQGTQGTDTTTHTGTDTRDVTTERTLGRTGNQTQTAGGKDTTTGSRSTTTSGSNSTSEDGTTKERATGRSGKSPQELLELSRRYITNSNALKWFCEKMNANFEPVLEVYG